MGFWPFNRCKHDWNHISCTLGDLGCPDIMVDVERIDEDETKYWYSCDKYDRERCFKYTEYPKYCQVHVKSCKLCKASIKYLCTPQGTDLFYVNWLYVMPLIEKWKKEHDLKETERMLNVGNVNYQRLEELEKQTKDQQALIAQLRSQLERTKRALTDSQKNDGIWDAIPVSEKKKIIKRFGHICGVKMSDLV